MGVFNKAEKRIESAVEKVFARAFKGYVHPVEIVAGIGACVIPVMSGARRGVWMFFTRVGIVVVAIVMIGHTVLL